MFFAGLLPERPYVGENGRSDWAHCLGRARVNATGRVNAFTSAVNSVFIVFLSCIVIALLQCFSFGVLPNVPSEMCACVRAHRS